MPHFLIVRRYAPFATFGGGFEGDIRTVATTSPTATARTVGIVSFDPTGVTGYKGLSSGSEFFGAGKWLAAKIGKRYSTVKAEVSNLALDPLGQRIGFTVHTAGSNPLVPIVAPDIDTFVDLQVTFGIDTQYNGTVRGDGFPNAEVFVVDPEGKEVLLFDFRTGGGRQTGPAALFGDHSRNILGTFAVNSVKIGPPLPVPATKGK